MSPSHFVKARPGSIAIRFWTILAISSLLCAGGAFVLSEKYYAPEAKTVTSEETYSVVKIDDGGSVRFVKSLTAAERGQSLYLSDTSDTAVEQAVWYVSDVRSREKRRTRFVFDDALSADQQAVFNISYFLEAAPNQATTCIVTDQPARLVQTQMTAKGYCKLALSDGKVELVIDSNGTASQGVMQISIRPEGAPLKTGQIILFQLASKSVE